MLSVDDDLIYCEVCGESIDNSVPVDDDLSYSGPCNEGIDNSVPLDDDLVYGQIYDRINGDGEEDSDRLLDTFTFIEQFARGSDDE